MGTTNKSLEDLKKELLNMHKQFDNLLADKKLSERLKSTVELENNTIDALENKKDILIDLDEEKKDVINLHGNVSDIKVEESNFVLENENLKAETKQEISEFRNENDFFVTEIEKQKQKNQYLSIKEKLDRIKNEINTKELEISLKTLEEKPTEELKSAKKEIIPTSAKKEKNTIKNAENLKDTVSHNPNMNTENAKKNKSVLNIVIGVLIIAIVLLVYFIFLT